MKHVNFFRYNIPMDNHTTGKTDEYIDVLGTWDTHDFYNDGRPMTSTHGVNLSFFDCLQVKDWHKAYNEIRCIVQNHFEILAREERINRAKAELIAAGELAGNPILERYESNVHPVFNDLIKNHFTPLS